MTQQYVLSALVSELNRVSDGIADMSYFSPARFSSVSTRLLDPQEDGFPSQEIRTISTSTVRMHLDNRLILITTTNYIV